MSFGIQPPSGSNMNGKTNAYWNNTIQNSDGSASSTQAQILREQWEDYQNRYQPIEDMLLSILNPGYATGQASEAASNVGASFTHSADAMNRQMKSYGLSLDPTEQASANQQLGIQKGLSEVDAYNKTLDASENRQFNALSPGYVQGLNTQNRGTQ